jgi:hypothetical protein
MDFLVSGAELRGPSRPHDDGPTICSPLGLSTCDGGAILLTERHCVRRIDSKKNLAAASMRFTGNFTSTYLF